MAEDLEYSKELRALALRFFTFDDVFWVKRTEKFMKLSSGMHDLREEINELLKIMRNGKPFKKVTTKNSCGGGGDVPSTRDDLNEYSMERMFLDIFNRAKRLTSWGSKSYDQRHLPHAEALAWIAYFAEFNKDDQKYYPGKNWVAYYNEYYASQIPADHSSQNKKPSKISKKK